MKETLIELGLTSAVGGLSLLSFKNNPSLKQYLYSVPSQLSAYSVPSLFIWQDFFNYYWTLVDDHLCLFARYDGNYYMPLPPLGSGFSPQAVKESFYLMDQLNSNSAISRIENVGEDTAGLYEGMGLGVRLNTYEYVYRREALAGLHGDSYKSKRWAINSFLRHYQSSFEPYGSEDFLQCVELLDDWKSMRQGKFKDSYYRALMEDATSAHCRAMEHWQDLGLVGHVVKIDGQVKGYTFGFELRPSLFCILLEICDLRVKGLSQFLFWRFCKELEGYTCINVLDDSGLENIRRVKESYHPERLVPSYTVSRV
ncbi:MAG: phosphatidylglycerol lysyltransferase domain-containing protein [Nitrospira sp.]|nr:phosphatidylglycerol lysyltransferase domain-containing protein [Nitrospira sp.]